MVTQHVSGSECHRHRASSEYLSARFNKAPVTVVEVLSLRSPKTNTICKQLLLVSF